MSDSVERSSAERFKYLIDQTQKLRREVSSDSTQVPGHALLSHWQCERLAMTYADYHAHKRYRLALDFFMSDLYGPTDFSQRDNDIARVYPIMVKMLSVTAIDSLSNAMQLNSLSLALDQRLLGVLVEQFNIDVAGSPAQITPQIYADAYRVCDNRDERLEQIELAAQAGHMLEEAVKRKIIYMTVKVARKPAQLAGFGELQSFIERGLKAFRKMAGSHQFIAALQARETYILEKIFAAAPVEEWYGDVLRGLEGP